VIDAVINSVLRTAWSYVCSIQSNVQGITSTGGVTRAATHPEVIGARGGELDAVVHVNVGVEGRPVANVDAHIRQHLHVTVSGITGFFGVELPAWTSHRPVVIFGFNH